MAIVKNQLYLSVIIHGTDDFLDTFLPRHFEN